MLNTYLNSSSLVDPDPYAGLSLLEIKRLQYPRWAHQILGVVLLIIWCVGLFFNTCVLLTFAKNKQLRSPTNYFVIGLAIADFSLTVFCIPLATMASLHGTWFAGDALCTYEGFMVYALGLSAEFMLTAIAIDRYIVIVKPLKAQFITKRVAFICVLGNFGLGFLWAIFPFFGWSSYGLEAPGISCGLHYEDQSVATMTYLVAITVFVFILPIIIMVFCYASVYLTVRNISKNTVTDAKSRLAKKNLKIEMKLLKGSVIMCTAFWCCWGPYAIVTFWGAFGDPNSIPILLASAPAIAAKSEVVWNPLLYVATNKQFRRGFYGVLPCTGLRDMLVKREDKPEAESEQSDLEEKDQKSQSKPPVESAPNPNAVEPQQDAVPKVEC